MQISEFGNQGYALLFKPGTYNENIQEGFYTQISGLGLNHGDVTINGNVSANASMMMETRQITSGGQSKT